MKGKEQRRETVIINGIERIVPPEVTFRDFASLVKRKGWTPEYLAEKFRGEIEGPTAYKADHALGRDIKPGKTNRC